VSADVGIKTSTYIIENLKESAKANKITKAELVKDLLKEELLKIMDKGINKIDLDDTPVVITVIGVNGVGKTTSIGKIAHLYKSNGKNVIMAAGDTFRAAAIDQLEIWAQRSGSHIIKQAEGSDPGAVIYDAAAAAKSRKADVLICDTAGRLHTKKNLMEELKKISRIIDREMTGYKRETFLVLDATTGQNAVNQAKVFNESCEITGIVLTKLDGTAKGGIVISIANELGIPVKLVGVGESINDLQPFNAKEFVEALFEG
jgi:fused signal recognition particle receptor